jgi:hypothetical protein
MAFSQEQKVKDAEAVKRSGQIKILGYLIASVIIFLLSLLFTF